MGVRGGGALWWKFKLLWWMPLERKEGHTPVGKLVGVFPFDR